MGCVTFYMKVQCSRCAKGVSKAVYEHSKAKYGKPLCFDCQTILNSGKTFKERFRIVDTIVD